MDTFDYDGHTISLRPLSSLELDKAEREGYEYVSPSLAKLIMRIRLRDVSLNKELGKLPPEMYLSIDRYYKEINYWIVYYSMKDFQTDDFDIDDVREMRYVHDIAMKVLGMSSGDTTSIAEVIRTPEGRELGKIIFEYNVPLTNEAWKMTPLQYKFCEITNRGVRKEMTKDDFERMVHGSVIPEELKKLVRK